MNFIALLANSISGCVAYFFFLRGLPSRARALWRLLVASSSCAFWLGGSFEGIGGIGWDLVSGRMVD